MITNHFCLVMSTVETLRIKGLAGQYGFRKSNDHIGVSKSFKIKIVIFYDWHTI